MQGSIVSLLIGRCDSEPELKPFVRALAGADLKQVIVERGLVNRHCIRRLSLVNSVETAASKSKAGADHVAIGDRVE